MVSLRKWPTNVKCSKSLLVYRRVIINFRGTMNKSTSPILKIATLPWPFNHQRFRRCERCRPFLRRFCERCRCHGAAVVGAAWNEAPGSQDLLIFVVLIPLNGDFSGKIIELLGGFFPLPCGFSRWFSRVPGRSCDAASVGRSYAGGEAACGWGLVNRNGKSPFLMGRNTINGNFQ